MSKLGILFNIDDLGGGLYGSAAYKILFNTIDSRQMSGCTLYDGDTNTTLRGNARQYCIAIESSSTRVLDAIKKSMESCNEPGLLAPSSRFLSDSAVGREPLVLSAGINSSGAIVNCKTGWVTSAYEKSLDKWRNAAQNTPPPGPATTTVSSKKWWQVWK